MELVIYQPQEDQFIQSITFNHEDIKQELELRLEKYKGLVYSDDNIKEAKTDRATLNKFKDAIENKRKEIKKQCMKPYEDFESKIKEITAMIDKPILAIDTQVKSYEQAKKDEKLNSIKEFFASQVGDLAELLAFDKVNNPKWLNATFKMAEIENEITATIDKVNSDLATIGGLKSEYELQIKDTYLKAFDLAAALREKARLEEQAAKLAEYNKRIEEQKKAKAMEATTISIVQQQPMPQQETAQQEEVAATVEVEQPKIYSVCFKVEATAEQLNALKEFMKNNDIKYGKVS